MHKINKEKCGFTLVELVLVVAISCILGGVLALSISTFLNRAKNGSSAVDSGVSDMSNVISDSEASLSAQRF